MGYSMQKTCIVVIVVEAFRDKLNGRGTELRIRFNYLAKYTILRRFDQDPLISIVLGNVVHCQLLSRECEERP